MHVSYIFLQENVDTAAFTQILSMFLPHNCVMILEAQLNAFNHDTTISVPHGKIDLVVVTPGEYTITDFSVGVLMIEGEIDYVQLATSMKTESTLCACQSRKYACFIIYLFNYNCSVMHDDYAMKKN